MEHVTFRPAVCLVFGFLGVLTSFTLTPCAVAATPSGPWQTNFRAAISRAQAEQKPILAAVTAVWCGPCRQMQQLTLNDAEVSRFASEHFVTVAIDGDRDAGLLGQLGVSAFPTTLILNSDGSVKHRWVGFQGAVSFRQELAKFVNPGQKQREEKGNEFAAVSAAYPSNASPFAFGGYCLVSLLDNNVLQRGLDQYEAEYKGTRVSFRSEELRSKFLANPERYWPVANGTCLVSSQEQHSEEMGDPRVGVLWKNRLWFFSDQASQQRFMQAPQTFSQGL